MIELTAEERRKFVAYLQQETITARGLAAEAEKLGPAGAVMAKSLRMEMAASAFVAHRLDTVEEMKIG